jgi:hypothetical protein
MTAENFCSARPDAARAGRGYAQAGVIMPNNRDLADMPLEWIPDAALRRRVLVDNPGRLYDFN